MVKKENIEEMRKLLNNAIKNNNKAGIFKVSKMLDRHITEYLYKIKHSSITERK